MYILYATFAVISRGTNGQFNFSRSLLTCRPAWPNQLMCKNIPYHTRYEQRENSDSHDAPIIPFCLRVSRLSHFFLIPVLQNQIRFQYAAQTLAYPPG